MHAKYWLNNIYRKWASEESWTHHVFYRRATMRVQECDILNILEVLSFNIDFMWDSSWFSLTSKTFQELIEICEKIYELIFFVVTFNTSFSLKIKFFISFFISFLLKHEFFLNILPTRNWVAFCKNMISPKNHLFKKLSSMSWFFTRSRLLQKAIQQK